ncbi:MAG TPA: sigma 54-interacting transcriptional regulator [Polyangiaceae bacterium]|nr:sigma 54-interacting transcriptional regulator [Polyangiaceae bacterium]
MTKRATYSKTTLSGESDAVPEGPAPCPPSLLALVIAWSSEPHRVGEIAFVLGAPAVLGRGADPTPEPRLRFHRQRPGGVEPCPPLAAPGLSRRQLLLAATTDGVSVRRVGQCALEVNGQPVDACVAAPGDVIRVGRELVLLCVERQAALPPCRAFSAGDFPEFGEADAAGIVGESPPVWQLREALAFAARAATHVLLLGESGTGKELAARALHALAAGADRVRPFVSRNAATLPPGLIDAELFGNVKNYPNPGMPERRGLVGEADGGTLFLDEIGELPPSLQAHLLRVMDSDGEYQRLGESATRRSRLRVVAATNRPLGDLKKDFAARLTSRVELPPLEARREDIPLLANLLVLRAAARSPEVVGRFVAPGKPPRARLSSALVAHLLRSSFPLNARDLDGLLWEAMAASPADVVEPPASLTAQTREPLSGPRSGPRSAPALSPGDPTAEQIRDALEKHGGNMTESARALGLSSRFVLHRLMKKLRGA